MRLTLLIEVAPAKVLGLCQDGGSISARAKRLPGGPVMADGRPNTNRGSWLVARGSLLVAHHSWLVAARAATF